MMKLITPEQVASMLHRRRPDSHKGDYGRALLVAGSMGMMGAALLSARACMRSGVGLLTARVPECGYQIVQLGIPEAKCDCDPNPHHHTQIEVPQGTEVIGIGPGLGLHPETQEALINFLKQGTDLSLVLDADALNILALHPDYISLLPQGTILTPHPGEMKRLNQDPEVLSRELGIVVALKGHKTQIFTPDSCFENTLHGNAGMAVGGSGDVLTGIILALRAQHYSATEAAVLGVWLHALAGDLALADCNSEESLLPSDLISHLGDAFAQSRSL